MNRIPNKRDAERIMDDLRDYVLWMSGKKCKDYEPGCCVCESWKAFEYLEHKIMECIKFYSD